MRIALIELKNFKRFTDLLIRDIPQTAKLVVVVGPNGCGKSSLFDALNHWHRYSSGISIDGDEGYFRKDQTAAFGWDEAVRVVLHGDASPQKGCVYLRSAFRNEPDFSVNQLTRPANPTFEARVSKTSQTDSAVRENYSRLMYEISTGVFDRANDGKRIEEYRGEIIGRVQRSMTQVFGDLVLNALSDPLGAGSFKFDKGNSTSYHYKALSGGERAAFDLILDLHLKTKFHGDAIYCIDELETHLHTRVQGALLRELTSIVPDEGQLWVTTHSLGVIRMAQKMALVDPGTVAILDFEGITPDIPDELTPSSLDRVSWDKFLSIALDDLSARVAPRIVFVCEGSAIGNRRKNFDAEIYDTVLASREAGVTFVSGGGSGQVAASGVTLQQALGAVLPGARIVPLVDRDAKSAREVSDFEATGGLVLPVRNIESFLLADDVLAALLAVHNQAALGPEVARIKIAAIAASQGRGNPADDLKSAAGDIIVALRRALAITRGGNTTDSFLRDTLAPLIQPGMPTYEAMRQATIGRV